MCILIACSSPEEKKARFYQKGKALLDRGDLVKARLEFKNAIPDLWAAANNLACILSTKANAARDLDRAYGLALKAIKLQPVS